MNSLNSVVASLILLSFMVSFAIFLLELQKNKKFAIICLIIGSLVPVFGVIMCIVMSIQFKEGWHEMASDETIVKYSIEAAEYVDKDLLYNMVPSNDALTLSGESERRNFLLGLLRQKDMSALNNTLKKALTNKDSEASHYAASAIMELQRESYSVMMDNEKIYKQDEFASYDDSIAYAVSIMSYLNCSEVGDLENYTFRNRYESVMKHILKNHYDCCSPSDFENLIDMLIKQGRYEEASIYSEKYRRCFPDSENGFIYDLKISYLQHDEDKFLEIISDIHNSDIILSPSALSMIRFWKNRGEMSIKR